MFGPWLEYAALASGMACLVANSMILQWQPLGVVAFVLFVLATFLHYRRHRPQD